MPSLLSRYQHDAASYSYIALPLTLLVSCTFANLGTSARHALLTNALAWAVICSYATLSKVGAKSLFDAGQSQRLGWIAGVLLALVTLTERAVEEWGGWWAKGLLPCVLYVFARNELVKKNTHSTIDSPPGSPVKARPSTHLPGSKKWLLILTTSGIITASASVGTTAAIGLGISSAILLAFAFSLIERAQSEASYGRAGNTSIIYSANNGLLSTPAKSDPPSNISQLSIVRDVAFSAAIATGIAAMALERFTISGLSNRGLRQQVTEDRSGFSQVAKHISAGIGMVLVNAMANCITILMIQRRGALSTSFIPLAAVSISLLRLNFSPSRLCFAVLCAASSAAFLDEQDMFPGGSRMQARLNRLLTLLAIIFFAFFTVQHFRETQQVSGVFRPQFNAFVEKTPGTLPETPLAPLGYTNARVHPVDQLVRSAESAWLEVQQSQSKTLDEAVTEYRRRYGIPPPPNFDKWYEFAKRKGVQVIDEYDSIYHSLLPFWALPPATIRARTREALGFNNELMGLLIRDGKVQHVEGGQEWLREAIVGMTAEFIEYLPDMDMAFNRHDEPRVVVPHDDLSQLIGIALGQYIPQAIANQMPKNKFSTRPSDLGKGLRVLEVKTTRFNVFAHQPTWLPSRLSCSPNSPARALFESDANDNLTSYALSELGFVYNHTAFTDICNSPSLASSFGFFDRPNAFNVVHELFPIFSQSKISSFQDILYPSPWYWYGKVGYNEEKDMPWEEKNTTLFWRGSTTGGFSRDGGWRRQHRQHIVQKLNAMDQAQIIQDVSKPSGQKSSSTTPEWKIQSVSRESYHKVIDVHFSHVGQCDPGDCDAQKEFFDVVEGVPQQDAWKYKYLLDMDGNAFSGRFYAFLKSQSLTFKMAIFREWHEEWIKPWVHYIPLSLRADEALEAVRYLSVEEEGKATAMRLAANGRDWANKTLRNEDLEVWLFRLMLEYGRLVDDNRATIGFAGS